MKKETLDIAKNAFEIEAKAILDTGEGMDWTAFEKAVGLLAKAQRIAVSGCGHSGIACRHFAHSMCCIERPARFLSPAEALHGGAGFMQPGDVFVAASRGGKTAELIPIIEIAKKKNVFVIVVTENLTSPMAKLGDVVVPMAVHREVDRYNLQGTSSFVALAAVFDALQAAVMEETGFRGDLQFGLIHPGGAVGQMLNEKTEKN
jgi:D-arabinose 5-phosphate isomerase GutQ